MLRVLTDRGTEYCGRPDRHEYQLLLALYDIDHTRTKAKHPQTNGICERFHKTIQDEFYTIAFCKKIYTGVEELQSDLDAWMDRYNTQRPHQGKRCRAERPCRHSRIICPWPRKRCGVIIGTRPDSRDLN